MFDLWQAKIKLQLAKSWKKVQILMIIAIGFLGAS
jgi:hypothetical protein